MGYVHKYEGALHDLGGRSSSTLSPPFRLPDDRDVVEDHFLVS